MTGELFEDDGLEPSTSDDADPEGGEHARMTWEDRNMLRVPPEILREDYTDSEWEERTRYWREGRDQLGD